MEKKLIDTVRKTSLAVCGTLFLLLGIAGILLPLLPTTPFLLLAAACYCRSSERLYQWLINHRQFGKPILYYRRFRAVSRRAKVISLVMLWSCIITSSLLVVANVWMRVVLMVVAVLVSGFIIQIRTLTPTMLEELAEETSKTE